jgi:hypothetical protein
LESSWRLNVPDFGWALSDVGLLARVVGSGSLQSDLPVDGLPGYHWLFDLALDIGMYVPSFPREDSTGFPNFPYGNDVDPD